MTKYLNLVVVNNGPEEEKIVKASLQDSGEIERARKQSGKEILFVVLLFLVLLCMNVLGVINPGEDGGIDILVILGIPAMLSLSRAVFSAIAFIADIRRNRRVSGERVKSEYHIYCIRWQSMRAHGVLFLLYTAMLVVSY